MYYISVFLIDINECTEETHSCDGNASCTNTIGSYNCTCNFGFEGNGLHCTGMYSDCDKIVIIFHDIRISCAIMDHFLFILFSS